MAMYINTELAHARPNKGWWGIANTARLQFQLTYEPERLSKWGHKTLARWARAGMCDRPGGQQGAYWRMHMWNVGADYVAMEEHASCEFKFYNQAMLKRIRSGPIMEITEAKFALISAANDDKARIHIIHHDPHSADMLRLEDVNRKSAGTLRIQRSGWGAPVHQQAVAFVNEIGHPLSGDRLERFYDSLGRHLTMKVEVFDDYQTDANGRFVSHGTSTRIFT